MLLGIVRRRAVLEALAERAEADSLKAAGMYAVAAPSPDFPLSDEILAMVDAHITTLEDFNIDLIRQIENQTG